MKKYTTYLISAVVLALFAGVFYNNVYIPKSTYETVQATSGDLKVTISGIGNVSAQNIYSITAQTGGKILNIFADDGTWVKKGDLLVVIDGVDLPEQLEVAKANLSKAKYEVISSKNDLENLKVQKELLKVTYNRYLKLKDQGFAAQSEYDKADAELKSIDATITAATSRINSIKANVVVASKTVDALRAKIDRLKVYAPVDGYVVAKEAQIAQSIVPSTSILKIVDPKTLWVETKIDERISRQIKPEQKATITLRSEPNKKYSAYVKRIKAMSDAVTLERGVDVAFVIIPEPFYINEQAEVVIEVKEYKDVLKVPLKVIVQKSGKLGMWTVKNSHAHFLSVEKIAQDDKYMAIANFDKETLIIVPNISKKPLSEDMKIHQ